MKPSAWDSLAALAAVAAPEHAWPASYGLHDMTVLLAACAAEPQRLRGKTGGLYVRIVNQLDAFLPPLSQAVERAFDATAERRLDAAYFRLLGFRLAKVVPGEESGFRLATTRSGRTWLGLPAKERLKFLIDTLRQNTEPKRGRPLLFVPPGPPLPQTEAFDAQRELEEAFRDLSPGVYRRLEQFLEHRARTRNPLVELQRRKKLPPRLAGPPERLQGLWAESLLDFLLNRLAPLGGAHLGVTADGLCFALTDAGRYLLAATSVLKWDEEKTAEVVVQPNFEVVFLSSSGITEAAIARFAERRGTGVGILFQITKRSVLAAAAGGLSAEEALATLRQVASKGVPDNVAREIAGWFAQRRAISVQTAIFIDCPDAETARRVVAAGGRFVERLTDTVVRVLEPKKKAEILRKLREMGVFVSGK